MRKLVIVVAMTVVGLGLAACVPIWSSGATLTATPLGPLVTLSWPAAADPDAGGSIASYRIDVDGVQVANVPAPATACVLTGLSPTTHLITLTAYDASGEWSGTNTTSPLTSLSTNYTNAVAGAGSVQDCVSTLDSDGDRLPDGLENGSGTFVSAANPGTSPANADTDNDGIKDGDETLGTTSGINLPGMGTKAVKKNILFEFDWFDDSNECGAHSHRPTAAIISRASGAFSSAPVSNPDGTTGITMISDYGQGGLFTGGNLVTDADGVIAGGVFNTDFRNIKAANFASARQGIFHYVLLPHRYNTNSDSSGQAELPGNDMIVSLYCYGDTVNVGNTIVHEVGHNLNLRHGGNVDTNYKPNYNSVMNYQYQFPGVDTNCTVPGDGKLDYSTGSRAALNELALIETNGICNGVDIDWNANGVIDAAPVAVDINGDGVGSTLTDYDDWSNISLASVTAANGASPFGEPTELVTEQPVPLSARGG